MNPEPTTSFKDLGIHETILGVLARHSFVIPTPIQAKVIPVGIQGQDIIGIAQTGTGKTLGFGIPMISRLLSNKSARGLVVLPTRELALQVDETMRKIGQTLGITTTVLIGGDSMTRQMRELKRDPTIIIATPGRLLDHMKQGRVSLNRVSIVVLDEADHMFDIGFAPQVREIMKKVPKPRQTLLFSATMPNEIAKLAMEHMELPLRIEVAPQGTAAKGVDQEIIIVKRPAKFELLVSLLKEQKGIPVLVFTRTKHGAKDVAAGLRNMQITAAEIHSNRSLGQRKEALEGFKAHRYQVLCATDIAARGIDVKDIGLVINYDLPEKSEDYVHRIGRTGRAGKVGKAISFATPDQKYDITIIERLMKKTIPQKSHEGAAMGQSTGPKPFRGNFGRGRFGRGAPPGAFKVHTNQPFKGGAPKAPAAATYDRPAYAARPSYSERSRPFNKGAFGSRTNPRANTNYRGPAFSTPQTRVSAHGAPSSMRPSRVPYRGGKAPDNFPRNSSYQSSKSASSKPSYSSRPGASSSSRPSYGASRPSYSSRPDYSPAGARPAARPGYGTPSYGSKPGHASAARPRTPSSFGRTSNLGAFPSSRSSSGPSRGGYKSGGYKPGGYKGSNSRGGFGGKPKTGGGNSFRRGR